ncbi:MAG TPA: M28 family peptidase [Pseudonocardia sp.]|nr:M28 family peptidase [Pseudonocardia sp.]
MRTPRGAGRLAALLLLSVVVAACSPAPAPAPPATSAPPATPAPDQGLPGRLVGAVTGDGVYRHLQELQRIADANGGNRALGTPGYDASVDYVAGVLRAAGYAVDTPEFTAHRFSVQEQRLTVDGTAVPTLALGYSPATPAGGLRAPLAAAAGEGCDAAALTGVPRGAVVLVRRGTCTFAQKSTVAGTAGAVGLLVVNNEDGPLSDGTLGERPPGAVPTAGLSRADGEALFGRTGAPVELVLNTTVSELRSRNVIAQTGTGNADQVVMAGAHLDSVAEGPGINDNGSGSATLLEVATQLGPTPPVTNAVRFAFWGAEEEGLLGSTAYVQGLDEADRGRIALYVNLDMVGSPNAGYYVYDGDNSDNVGAGPGPNGSATLERVLVESLAAAGAPAAGTDFDGRSDYGPFIEAGIASGGLFTGASEPMSAGDAQRWGGDAGKPHDACYHQACDRIDTIDRTALDRNADATAATLARFALSTDGLKTG